MFKTDYTESFLRFKAKIWTIWEVKNTKILKIPYV